METAEKQKQLSLLLVDDDAELRGMMKEYFAEAGHHLDCAHNGRDGLASALNGAYDLAILDVMLPIFDGLTVLDQLRRRKDLPVIMLTARVQRHDRILGLNAGADDYLPKPFDPDELLARIRAVLRRTDAAKWHGSTAMTIGDIQLNAVTREVRVSDLPVELTAMEFDLLEMLMRSAGRVVSRDEITVALFQREATPYDRFLDVHIIGATGVLCWLASAGVVSPIRKIAASIALFGQGNLSVRADTRRKDEIGQLGRSFNQMAERLQRLIVSEGCWGTYRTNLDRRLHG
jgi:DNA-binding response OmpR family regulator